MRRPGNSAFSSPGLGCAGSDLSPFDVAGPEIEYTEDAVIVTLGVRRFENAVECVQGAAVPVRVTLKEPLAGRQLLDGRMETPVIPPTCDADLCP